MPSGEKSQRVWRCLREVGYLCDMVKRKLSLFATNEHIDEIATNELKSVVVRSSLLELADVNVLLIYSLIFMQHCPKWVRLD